MEKVSKVTVVSGLPRSGTSLLMQMLKAGGMDIFTDGVREPDKHNPKGYFEYEKVKHLRRDNSWVGEARGMAIKVVSGLLQYLPLGLSRIDYDIIFMLRSIDEVLVSQAAMLEGIIDDNPDNFVSDAEMQEVISSHIDDTMELLTRRRTSVLYLHHRDVIESPHRAARRINLFLEQPLDEEAMASIVDPSLYRQRIDYEEVAT